MTRSGMETTSRAFLYSGFFSKRVEASMVEASSVGGLAWWFADAVPVYGSIGQRVAGTHPCRLAQTQARPLCLLSGEVVVGVVMERERERERE